MSDSSRRTEERAPVDFQVDYLKEGDYVLSFSKNISLGGMFLCTPDPPAPGSNLKLIFPVEEFYQTEVMAVVVWINSSPKAGETGMGVQFFKPAFSTLEREYYEKYKAR